MTDAAWTRVCGETDVEPGEALRVDLAGLPPLAVFNLEGRYYVTDDRCTHAEASLSEGWVDGEIVECPFHGGCFHIPTGKPAARPVKKPLRTYEVMVENGDVMIRRPESQSLTASE